MNLKRELRETLRYIVIGLILAVALNFGLGLVLGAEKPVMAVVSSSMEPTFSKGDLVVIKGIAPEEVKVGDIIVYYNPFKHIPVVHRVVAIEEIDGKRYFITKGDNNRTNPYPDQDPRVMLAPPVSEQNLKGKVIFWIPKIGWVKVLFTELAAKYGLATVAVVLLLLFVGFGMVEDYVKKLRRSS
ncbi:signal peptidase I [Candidatus Pyrohabitans sp.]